MRVVILILALLAALSFTGRPQPAHATSCGGTVLTTGYGWSSPVNGRCNVAGYPGFYKGMSWFLNGSSSGYVCVQYRGFSYYGIATWVNVGCGTSGRGTVYWGNVWAQTQARAEAVLGWTPFTIVNWID